MLRRTSICGMLAALSLVLVGAGSALAAPAVSGEFALKTEIDTNNKIVQGPDGNIWATLQGPAEDVARITPAGEVSEFDLAVAGASGIATGSDGNLWVTRPGGLTRFSPADPVGSKKPFEIAAIEGNSPIVGGPDGNLWVATKDTVLRIPPATGVPTPFSFPGLLPTDIDVAGSELVISDTGTSKRILAVSLAGTSPGEFQVGGPPQGVGGNPNGTAAFTQPVNEPKEMGLLAPGSLPVVLSIPGKDPFGITLGADAAYWSPEFTSNGLMRLSADGKITNFTGFAKESGPRQIAAGPNNTLWVTLEMTNKIGRVSGLEPPLTTPPPPPTAEPRTKIDKGRKGRVQTTRKRAKVKFRFSSPDAGASFQCRVVRVVKKGPRKAAASAGKKKPLPKAVAFKACRSPKVLMLKPGRYRFEVRAVLNGIVDATPARSSFHVVRVLPIDDR